MNDAPPRPLRILVFDDDLISNQDFLAGLPAEFIFRRDADRAEADVAEFAPDLVFMDFSMNAERDGIAAVQALRAVFPFERLPIIAISSDARMNRFMLVAGATDGIPKMALPERFRELLAAYGPRPS